MEIKKAALLTILLMLYLKGSESCFNINKNSSFTIKSGDTFYQECVCTEHDQSVENLRWINPQGKEVQLLNGPGTDTVVFAEKRGRSLSLNIANVSKSRAGTYSCVVDSAGQRYSLNYHIRAYDPLYFVDPVKSQFVIKGQDSIIKCEARGDTKPLMNWYKTTEEDMIQLSDDEKYELVPEGLKVKEVVDEDLGVYRCTAQVVETGEEGEQLITVEVLVKPSIEAIVAEPATKIVVGESLTIDCVGTGVPTLEFQWNKTSETNPDRTLEWPKVTNKLSFDSVKPDDRGIYECVASNRAGMASKTVTIEVLIPPKIESFYNVTGAEGTIVQMMCTASGRPMPNINIVFENDINLSQTSVVKLNVSETERTLVVTFLNLSRQYDGSYICNASNEVDTASEVATVTVHHRPYFASAKEIIWGWNGSTLTFTCQCESNPPAEIQWWFSPSTPDYEKINIFNFDADRLSLLSTRPEVELSFLHNQEFYNITIKDNLAYGTYKCISKNYLGNSTKIFSVFAATVPPEINNFTVQEVTATSVTFNIATPENYQGPEVIGFICEFDEVTNYEHVSIHNNRSWAVDVPYKVEKLKPGTSYRFKFAAINEMGHGNWGQPIEQETPNKSVPDQPTLLANDTSELYNENLVLKWGHPENNGEPVDLYFLQYCPFIGEELNEDGCNIVEIAPSKTEFDLTGLLESNRTYEILLAAHNSLGNSSGAQLLLNVPISDTQPLQTLSAQVIIGLSVLAVILGILAVDLVLFFWRRQGMIASCYYRRSKKIEVITLSRDKKGLLRDNDPSAAEETLKRAGNGDKTFEYTSTTGIITGKHSTV